jgi:hypothetical protein
VCVRSLLSHSFLSSLSLSLSLTAAAAGGRNVISENREREKIMKGAACAAKNRVVAWGKVVGLWLVEYKFTHKQLIEGRR